MTAVSSGTLVYATVHEVINAPLRSEPELRITARAKCAPLALGFAAMSTLAVWT